MEAIASFKFQNILTAEDGLKGGKLEVQRDQVGGCVVRKR